MTTPPYNIGNYVTVDNQKYLPTLKGVICQVSKVEKRYDTKAGKDIDYVIRVEYIDSDDLPSDTGQWIEFIKPIPLSVEWLDKMGFVKNGNHWDFNGFCFIESEKSISLLRPKPKYPILFVHQLQNWYRAYYNENLEIK